MRPRFSKRVVGFEFHGGGKWRQNDYKYHYYYEYMPQARVVDDGSGCRLIVEGMDDSVDVVRRR